MHVKYLDILENARDILADAAPCACAPCVAFDDFTEGRDEIPLWDWTDHPAIQWSIYGTDPLSLRPAVRADVRALLRAIRDTAYGRALR